MNVSTVFQALLALAPVVLAINPAGAQPVSEPLPCRTVSIVAPFPAGSTTDTIARALSTKLSADLGRAVVIENKPGAEGQVAATDVMRSPPNGCRLLFATSGNLSVAPQLRTPPTYDPRRDFTAIADVGRYTYILYVRQQFPANTFSEFIAAAKAAPGRYTYGTGSNTNFLAFGYIGQLTRTELRRVPYRGEPPAFTDLIGGQIDAIVATTMGVPFVRDHKLKALAVMSRERSPLLPEVPTFAEAGLKNFDIVPWAGLVGPAKMDPATVTFLTAALNRALSDPAVHSAAAKAGFLLTPSTQEQFKALIAEQHIVYGDKVRQLGLSAE